MEAGLHVALAGLVFIGIPFILCIWMGIREPKTKARQP